MIILISYSKLPMLTQKKILPQTIMIMEKLKHCQKLWWRSNSGCFYNYGNKLFTGKAILRFGAAPFIFILAVLSSLAVLLALFPIYCNDKSGYGFPNVIHHILVGFHQTNLFSNNTFSLNALLQIVRFTVLF